MRCHSTSPHTLDQSITTGPYARHRTSSGSRSRSRGRSPPSDHCLSHAGAGILWSSWWRSTAATRTSGSCSALRHQVHHQGSVDALRRVLGDDWRVRSVPTAPGRHRPPRPHDAGLMLDLRRSTSCERRDHYQLEDPVASAHDQGARLHAHCSDGAFRGTRSCRSSRSPCPRRRTRGAAGPRPRPPIRAIGRCQCGPIDDSSMVRTDAVRPLPQVLPARVPSHLACRAAGAEALLSLTGVPPD